MSLTLLEINYNTNFFEYPMTYQYTPLTGINTQSMLQIYNNYCNQLPCQTLLFTDMIKLDSTDYPSSMADLLELLSSPQEYMKFLEKKFAAYKKKNNKSYKISNDERIIRKITQYNINVLFKKLFKIGNLIFLPGNDPNSKFFIEDYSWVQNQFSESVIPENEMHPEITKLSILVKLTLNQETASSPRPVGMRKLKEMDCKQRINRINTIYSSLIKKKDEESSTPSYKKRSIKKTPSLYKSGGKRKIKHKKKTNYKRKKSNYRKKRTKKKKLKFKFF